MNLYLVAQETMSSAFDPTSSAMEAFNKHAYHGKFESYYGKMLPAFDAIEQLYHTVGEPDMMLSNMADSLVSQAKSCMDAVPRRKKDELMMSLNLQLAVFVYPSILHYKGESSKPLVDKISAAWKEAFPKSNVQAAEVEYIEKGFKRKFCYITTAVCDSLGREDDCYELTLLRSYRDGYLSSLEHGEEMIRSYYDLAPTIVKHIDAQKNAKEIYQSVYEAYIRPCIRLIENGENEKCARKYIQMVQDMKTRYFTM